MARRSKYDPDETPKLAKQYAEQGMTNEEIAQCLGITRSTLYEWQNRHSEFMDALKKGKISTDTRVEQALLKRALGYQYEERKTITTDSSNRTEVYIKEVPPDTTAQIFWLKNRKPDEWRNAQPDDKEKVEELIEGMKENARAVLQQETS